MEPRYLQPTHDKVLVAKDLSPKVNKAYGPRLDQRRRILAFFHTHIRKVFSKVSNRNATEPWPLKLKQHVVHQQTHLWSRRYRNGIRLVLLTTILFLIVSIWQGVVGPSYATLPEHYNHLAAIVRNSDAPGRANVHNEKIFIAANIVNEDLVRGEWGQNLIALTTLLGEENVFVSIYENDSGKGTVNALDLLRKKLKCNSSIEAGDHVSLAKFSKVQLPNGEKRVQRITYLAEMRNRLLRPLHPTSSDNSSSGFRRADGVTFDKVLFLNDVLFSPLDAVQLLFSTNALSGRAQYRAACAMDFVQLFKLYDTFVVRDTDGYRVALQYFPWFTYRGSGRSRRDVLSMTDAVSVRSCWGGMAAFAARVFQPRIDTTIHQLSHVGNERASLQFRSGGEPFWEAAECCLIFADMESKFGKPSELQGTGVYINPYIRTAYSSMTWKSLPFFTRFERATQPYQALVDFLKPPEWNPRRTHEPGEEVDEVVWVPDETLAKTVGHSVHGANNIKPNPHDYSSRVRRNPIAKRPFGSSPYGQFELQHRLAPTGGFCGQRRMFVMKEDVEAANKMNGGKNWESVHVPWYSEPNE